jgi:hypothetical protein
MDTFYAMSFSTVVAGLVPELLMAKMMLSLVQHAALHGLADFSR